MAQTELSSSSGYHLGPPWLFRGRALYQLHLVKAEIARAFIPKELKLVEAFGYTLGGLFLANYDDSPAGKFDELVVIAGIIWNPPTSCAWAARVLVNSDEACRHGRKEIGLPSYVATFSKKDLKSIEQPHEKRSSFDMIGMGSFSLKKKQQNEIRISETEVPYEMSIANLQLPFDEPKRRRDDNKWMGPAIKMSLPSFSGLTIHNPRLLKYSCQIECRVRITKAARISRPECGDVGKCSEKNNEESVSEVEACERSMSVLLSKPVLALEFNFLKMRVWAPTIVTESPKPTEDQAGHYRTCGAS